MDTLQRHVRHAQWLLAIDRFVQALPWCWFAALCLALGCALAERWGLPFRLATPWLIGAALALGSLAAGAMAWWRGRGPLAAAVEIDRRFGLRERVSSWWSLSRDVRATPAGEALLADAVRRLERLELREQFHLRPSKWTWLPLLPAGALAAVLLFWPAVSAVATPRGTGDAAARVHVAAKELEKKLTEQKRAAEQAGLQDADHLFEQLKQGTDELTRADTVDRKQALQKLNDLSRELAERREALGDREKLRRQLESLRNFEQGPANDLAQALRQADLAQAQKAIEKIRQQLADGKLDAETQKQLAQQLESLTKKLHEAEQARREAREELQRRLEQARQAGQTEQAEALAEQLNRLQKQEGQAKQLESLASRLQSASRALQGGQAEQAGKELEALAQQLAEMNAELEQSEALESALESIGDAKEAMNCARCEGQGCEACQGGGNRWGRKEGEGLGRGRGAGERPEARTDTGLYDARTRQQVGRGQATVVDQVEGPNLRGTVEQQIQREFAEAASADSDPLTDQPLPRSHREHAREYFEALRQGQ